MLRSARGGRDREETLKEVPHNGLDSLGVGVIVVPVRKLMYDVKDSLVAFSSVGKKMRQTRNVLSLRSVRSGHEVGGVSG